MVYLCKLCDEFLSPGKPGMFVKLINMKDTITNDEFGKEFGEQETHYFHIILYQKTLANKNDEKNVSTCAHLGTH